MILQHVQSRLDDRPLLPAISRRTQDEAERAIDQQRSRREDSLGHLPQIHHADGRDFVPLDLPCHQTYGPVAGRSSGYQQHRIDLLSLEPAGKLGRVGFFQPAGDRDVTHERVMGPSQTAHHPLVHELLTEGQREQDVDVLPCSRMVVVRMVNLQPPGIDTSWNLAKRRITELADFEWLGARRHEAAGRHQPQTRFPKRLCQPVQARRLALGPDAKRYPGLGRQVELVLPFQS